ncbi:MAG: cytochrome c biogenesis protein CcdA [Chloroflexi bacterium]|nr:cytochrome c biogenesis protein CcdA [Chloroflexota bacterium]
MAFLAGLVSCISPCVLPVIPVYAGFVAGGSGTGWSSIPGGALAAPVSGSATWRAVGFLLGFLGVFVALWASIGVVGFALMSAVPLLRQVTGALIVAMGLLMISGRHPMLRVPTRLATVGRGGPLLLGAGVAVGWTPCIGPTLGAILALAASAPTASAGLLLLVAYAAGLAVPFLLVLVALRRFRGLAGWLAERRRIVDVVTGILVATVGVLVFSGAFARLAGFFNVGII